MQGILEGDCAGLLKDGRNVARTWHNAQVAGRVDVVLAVQAFSDVGSHAAAVAWALEAFKVGQLLQLPAVRKQLRVAGAGKVEDRGVVRVVIHDRDLCSAAGTTSATAASKG